MQGVGVVRLYLRPAVAFHYAQLRVRCKLNEFDDYINKYFSHPVDLWALDPESVTDLGDIVLIRKNSSSDRPSRLITHIVERVIHSYGHIIDPITNKRIIKLKPEEELDLEINLVKEIIEEPLQHDVLLLKEKSGIQRSRLQTRKLLAKKNRENKEL